MAPLVTQAGGWAGLDGGWVGESREPQADMTKSDSRVRSWGVVVGETVPSLLGQLGNGL